MNPRIIKAIAVTAELTGTELSEAAIRVMESDLSEYAEAAVLRALDRCRKELKGRLTLAAVLDRAAEADGRPGPEEAWSVALASNDEAVTVVWTDEIARAMEVARPLLDARDKVAARMAFIERYAALVREAREAKAPCRWLASIGYDVDLRTTAIAAAVTAGRLTHDAARHLLPAPAQSDALVSALIAGDSVKLLAHIPEADRAAAMRGIDGLRAHLAELDARAAARDAEYEAAELAEKKALAERKADMLRRAQARIDGEPSCAAASAGR